MTGSVDRSGGTLPLLEVRAVTKRFGGLVANQAISFDVTPGEIVGVIGPNGAGKSTLFDVVTGFHRPESGEVRLAGEALGGLRPDQINRRGIARTFQKLRPFSGMTVRDNVVVGALARATSVGSARAEADRCLALVGLAEKGDRLPHELSGGEQQRVSIARAFVNHPRLLIADEPTGNLDPETSIGIMQLLYRINRTGTTVIVATHDREMVDKMQMRVIGLEGGRLVRDQRQAGYALAD